MQRVILHIDMNAYFASCAQLVNPNYRNKPVAIGGKSSRSIVSTASYEARSYGVRSAMPIYMAKRLCPPLIIVAPDFALYEYYTNQFLTIIRRYSSKIELASIDECYVDISEEIQNVSDPIAFVTSIQQAILHQVGLPCSIGVAPNKFLAKMASDMKKPLGITVLRKKDISTKLWPVPIGDMYGVGKKTSARLHELGIQTIGDFAKFEEIITLKHLLGKAYETLRNWSNGVDEAPVELESSIAKSVGNSRTFPYDTNDYVELKAMISRLAKMVAERSQEEELLGTTIALAIRYQNFKTINRSLTLTDPTNDYEEIFVAAMHLFDINYEEGDFVRLLGVTLQNVAKMESFVKQISLFEERKPLSHHHQIDKIVLDINQKLGIEALKVASKVNGKKEEASL